MHRGGIIQITSYCSCSCHILFVYAEVDAMKVVVVVELCCFPVQESLRRDKLILRVGGSINSQTDRQAQ